ncbi:MAG: hypothetical protein Q7T08_04510 [Devosia sp.]|nr:hypothetical protein [Devosia sp.]
MAYGPTFAAGALVLVFTTHAALGLEFWSNGKADASCGLFIAASEGIAIGRELHLTYEGREFVDEMTRQLEWVAGFVSGANMENASIGANQARLDGPTLDLWLRNYCKAHPTHTLSTAAMNLLVEQHVNYPKP